jgi:ATP adenylyltransferase
MDYIKSLSSGADADCFFCQAAAATDAKMKRELLAIWTTEHSVVLINRYPYANGHLLVAPKAHKSELQELTETEGLDLHVQTVAAMDLLKQAISAQGFNIGINVGRVAGAGMPGHVHQHVVPRWGGDTNFMSIVGDVKIVPQAMTQLYDELVRIRELKK